MPDYVIKRSGERSEICFDKVTSRLTKLGVGLDIDVVNHVIQQVIKGVRSGIQTRELDLLGALKATEEALIHPDFGILASRLIVSNMHKETPALFSQAARLMYAGGLIAPAIWAVVDANRIRLDMAIKNKRDYHFNYFGLMTLQEKYLKKYKGHLIERPQYLYMRMALQFYGSDIDAVIEVYDALSQHEISHGTPTMYNAGTTFPQMASCFLLTTKSDSIDGIYDTLKTCALLSKYGGGIGINIHDIRAKGSYIAGTDGYSNGNGPMLKVFESTALYVDQGGGKRKGSFAVYLEPWHADIETFLELRRKTGNESERARKLFYALWVPDLFMKRVHADQQWTLFCPRTAPGLANCYGEEFERLYESYEAQGLGTKTLRARDLIKHICTVLIEEGMPYFMFKDHCNRKSNQNNLGTIRNSNLCCEIVEFSSPDELAVCNIAAINLKRHVKDGKMQYLALQRSAGLLVRNLNRVIDIGYTPVPEAVGSNAKHRPLGIGVVGLADAFMMMGIAYEDAIEENKLIFEHIYYGAMRASIGLAKQDGAYASFAGSPLSRGEFQFDLWGVTPSLDWGPMRAEVMQWGARNSLLIALMPTASTAQIVGGFESFEVRARTDLGTNPGQPIESNFFVRSTLVNNFTVINEHLIKALMAINLYTPAMRSALIAHGGSIQNIAGIPQHIKRIFKTRYEVPNHVQLRMAADRSAFVCQACSQNASMVAPTPDKVWRLLYHAWVLGLKTGIYYLHTMPSAKPVMTAVQPEYPMPMPPVRAVSAMVEDSCEACSV